MSSTYENQFLFFIYKDKVRVNFIQKTCAHMLFKKKKSISLMKSDTYHLYKICCRKFL